MTNSFLGRRTPTLVIPLILFLTHYGAAQFMERGEQNFEERNYVDAASNFKRVIKKDPNNMEAHFKLGLSILRDVRDRSEAIPHFKKVMEDEDFRADHPAVTFHLAKSHHYAMNFDRAIELYKRYAEKVDGEKEKKVEHRIGQCRTGKRMVKNPREMTLVHPGEPINTEFPDHTPLLTPNGKKIVFTTRRRSNVGSRKEFDGYYSSDIWIAKTEGKPTRIGKAKNAGKGVNTRFDEQATWIGKEGKRLYFYPDHIDEKGKVYKAEAQYGRFREPEEFEDPINVPQDHQLSASRSPNGQFLFFTSDREGGHGGMDIYWSKKLPNGEWAKPRNIGKKINTPHDEGHPIMGHDNKTLYFSSKGHEGMGGFDLFTTDLKTDEESWTKPENMGYPINDPYDNRTITFTKSGAYGYISTIRSDSKGSKDIYCVKDQKILKKPQVYKLNIENHPFPDTTAIVIRDQEKDTLQGIYRPNPHNKEYTLALPPGRYSITVEDTSKPKRSLRVKEADVLRREVRKMGWRFR